MKEMLNDEKGSQALKFLILFIVAVAMIGAFLYFFNNPRYIVLGIVDKTSATVFNEVEKNAGAIEILNQNILANLNLKYDVNIKGNIDEEPMNIALKNNITADINLNKNNAYNVIEIGFPKAEETIATENEDETKELNPGLITGIVKGITEDFEVAEEQTEQIEQSEQMEQDLTSEIAVETKMPENVEDKYSIYYQDGIFILDDKVNSKFIKLNEEPLELNNSASSTINDYKVVYFRFLKEFEGNLKDKDFYRITDKTVEGPEKKTTINQYGISLSEGRMNELLIETLTSLERDKKFITALTNIQNKSGEENKYSIKDRLDNTIKELQNTKTDPKKAIDIIVTTEGFMNEKINKIEVISLDDNIETARVDGVFVNNKLTNVSITNGNNIVVSAVIENRINGYTLSINNNSTTIPVDVTLILDNYGESRGSKVQFNGTVLGYTVKFLSEIRGTFSEESTKTNLLNRQYDLSMNFEAYAGEEKVAELGLIGNFETANKDAVVETKTLYSLKDLDQASLEYYSEFMKKTFGGISH